MAIVCAILALAAVAATFAPAGAQSAARRKVWSIGEPIHPLHLNAELDALVRSITDMAAAMTTETLVVTGAITEGGTLLSAKYLGIGSKAADADRLDGYDSPVFMPSKGTIEALLTGQIGSHTHAGEAIDGGTIHNARLPAIINASTEVQVAGVPVVLPATFVDTDTAKVDTAEAGVIRIRCVLK
jgi:phosphoribosylcarboxyaminoimidazole (NCAIR) mutase